MYIKINFTGNMGIDNVHRLISHLVENSSITDTASAQTISAGWRSNFINKIDWETSEVFRGTGTSDNVLCTVTTQGGSSNGSYYNRTSINFRFPIYDDPDDYYWVTMGALNYQYYGDCWWRVGDNASAAADANLLTNYGPTSAPSYRPGQLKNGQIYGGTGRAYTAYNNANASTIRSVIVYVTDKGLLWATTHGVSAPTGYGTTYSNGANFAGPFIFSQYTRYDHWNTAENGIIPMCFTEPRATSVGHKITDYNQVNLGEPTYVSGWRAFNFPQVQPKVGTSYPMNYFDRVHWGSGTLFNDINSLQTAVFAATANSGADYYDPSYNALVEFRPYYRYPSADLKDIGFAMHPIQIRNSRYNFGGGNLSDQSGMYLFNGDYFPGDEFIYNNKTYAIIPTWDGYTNRVGIAVPKE